MSRLTMGSNAIFEAFLSNLGYALFEYVGDGLFRTIGSFPTWLAKIWGSEAKHRTSLRLGDFSPFLENFVLDAEEFWKSKGEGPLKSGNWTESGADGTETPLEASALRVADRRILLVQNFTSSFAEQQPWLQTARDSLLEHERLMREIQKKEILLHCIIHDLSQPLSAMRGCFNCLTIGDLPDDLRPFVETGQRESYRQEQMIRGILEAFSGDLAAQHSLGAKETQGDGGAATATAADLAACAQHAVQNFSAAFTEKGVRLQSDPALDLTRDWRCVGDAPRVDRIFGNLLENAMRYSPKGTTVTIGIEDKGGELNAFVDDQGPGLPKDQAQDKLFGLFAKGKDRPGKAGLGLYFCKMTVERWGGHIGAETRPGGGSRFWFRVPRASGGTQVPRATGEADAKAATRSATSGSPGASPARRKGVGKAARTLRILVADDTDVNRDLAIELLKKRGHTAMGVCDGHGALAALEKQHFDVVLMDEVMPGMSGVDAMHKIREKEVASGKHQIIVGLTGNATAEDEKRLLDAGMDAFLSKPFDMYRLFDLVESLADGARQARAAEEHASAESTAGVIAALSHSVTSASGTHPAPPGEHAEDVAKHLERTTGGNEKLIRTLVKSFLADAPKKLADVHRAIVRQDAEKLAAAAHALKGAIAIFGMAGAFTAAKNLEAMGRRGSTEGVGAEFQTLEAQLERLEGELQQLTSFARAKSAEKHRSNRKVAPAPRKR